MKKVIIIPFQRLLKRFKFFYLQLKKKKDEAILSLHYFYGIRCMVDLKKSEELCILGSSKGNKFAEALQHYFGYGVEINKNKAFLMFNQLNSDNKSDQEELSYIIYFLGRCYHKSEGTSKDVDFAKELYERSSDLNNSVAKSSLGYLYANNLVTPKFLSEKFFFSKHLLILFF